MAQGGDLRVLLGALAGVGLGGVLLLTALPMIVPLEGARPARSPSAEAPEPTVAPAGPAVAAAPEAGPTAPAVVAAPGAAPVPRFDTVRVAPDGSGLVAGQAGPGAIVSVLAGEGVAAEVTADAEGRFVAFLDLPPSAEPRALSLRDAAGRISEETVIVAPTEGVPSGPVADRAGTAPDGTGPERPAVAPETTPEVATAAGPAARDLPSDQPTPSLALAGNLAAALPRLGSGAASPATEAPASEATAPGGAAVEIASTEPQPGQGAASPAEPSPLPAEDVASAGTGAERSPAPADDASEIGPEPADSSPVVADAGPADVVAHVPNDGPQASSAPDEARPSAPVTVEGATSEPAAASPLVADAAPAEAPTPAQGDMPRASAIPAEAPPSVAVAIAGPVPAAPDDLPEHGPPPTLADAPGALPSPESGAPGQAAVLVSDAEGVRVLQPALPPGADAETLATVALDAIAYGGEGEALLSGRASGGGAVRLYLDNALVAEGPVRADGQWSAALDGAEEGTFTLRLDQLDAEGEVVSRSEMPFRREARSDLAALMAEAQEAGQTIAVRTVQPGNTLWAIARDRYGEPLMYVRVYEMNRDRIRDPDLIYPGQVFILPATAGR